MKDLYVGLIDCQCCNKQEPIGKQYRTTPDTDTTSNYVVCEGCWELPTEEFFKRRNSW